MNRVLAAILFLLLPLAILGQVDTNRDADFQQGNRFYEQKDYANALPYFQRAAEVGNVDAQNNLGVMYHFGEGVSKDFSKAAEWYRKAAEKNHVKAQFNLGVLYQDMEDYTSAIYWYKKAADQGHAKSQTNLGTLYYYGVGVMKDVNVAMSWYGKAANQGDALARSCLAQLQEPPQEKKEEERPPMVVQKPAKVVEAPKKPKPAADDVDTRIPKSETTCNTVFAVIIGNEKYDDETDVLYAENDATMFKEYCQQTLGINEKHIKFITNAGYNDMRKAVNWLDQGLDSYDGEGSAIFYYAGHGIPDESEKSAYLLPTDGIGSDVGSAYSLEKLYDKLGDMEAQSITVFLDACFSGSKRDGGMMSSARGVALKVKQEEPEGKMVVFTAAQGDETAYPYKSKQHGMFTYYLLKKLQETKGEATLGELADYIIKEVKRQSFDENNRKQTPVVKPSSDMGDGWRKLKLK